MQTILLSCIAVVLVLLCILCFSIKKQLDRLRKRTEQKFQLQHQLNRHFLAQFFSPPKNERL
jgi:predicted DsbA family dithiol-disulfide isomerase